MLIRFPSDETGKQRKLFHAPGIVLTGSPHAMILMLQLRRSTLPGKMPPKHTRLASNHVLKDLWLATTGMAVRESDLADHLSWWRTF